MASGNPQPLADYGAPSMYRYLAICNLGSLASCLHLYSFIQAFLAIGTHSKEEPHSDLVWHINAS